MRLLKFLTVLIPFSFLASCGQADNNKTPTSLDDLDSANVLSFTGIKLSDILEYEITNSTDRLSTISTNTSGYTEQRTSNTDPIRPFYNDTTKSLVVYTKDQQDKLKASFFSSFTDETTKLNTLTISSDNTTSFLKDTASAETNLFANLKNLTRIDLTNFDFKETTSFLGMFKDVSTLTDVIFTGSKYESVVDATSMFESTGIVSTTNIVDLDTTKFQNLTAMFKGLKNLADCNFYNWNFSSVSNFSSFLAESGAENTTATKPFTVKFDFHFHQAEQEEVGGNIKLGDPVVVMNPGTASAKPILATNIFSKTAPDIIDRLAPVLKDIKANDVTSFLNDYDTTSHFIDVLYTITESTFENWLQDKEAHLVELNTYNESYRLAISVMDDYSSILIYSASKLVSFTKEHVDYENLEFVNIPDPDFLDDEGFFEAGLFQDKQSFHDIELPDNFDFKKTTSLANLFNNTSVLAYDFSTCIMTNVTDVSGIVANTRIGSTRGLIFPANANIKKYDSLFAGCNELTDLDLSGFNFKEALSLNEFFLGAGAKKINSVVKNPDLDLTNIYTATAENEALWSSTSKPGSLVTLGDNFILAKRVGSSTPDFPLLANDLFKDASPALIEALTK